MREFFSGQMDYLFFSYGLAFILLFAACLSLQQQQKKLHPWGWLASFGLTHGINEWLDMLALSLGDSEPFQWIRVVVLGISFLCLFEFGRLTAERLKYLRIGRWIYWPLLLVVMLELPQGAVVVNAVLRYSVGLTGGLLAALALGRSACGRKVGSRGMAAGAVAMAVYAVLSGCIPPRAEVLLADRLNQEMFLQWTAFPVQLWRACAAWVIAIGIWGCNEESALEKSAYRWMGIRRQLLTAAPFLILGAVLVLGWLWTGQQGRQETDRLKGQLLIEAQRSVAAVAPEMVRALSATAADMDDPVYEILKVRLQRLRSVMASVRFIYLMRQVDGRIVFLADSENHGSKDESLPGQVYEEAAPTLKNVFVTGKGIVDDPITDRWGSWVSAYVPLKDSRTGQMIAVLGVDQNAHDFKSAVAVGRVKGILPLWIICLGVLFVLANWRRFIAAIERGAEGGKPEFMLQWGMAVIIMGCGATLTATLFWELRNNAKNILTATFLQHATSRVQGISDGLDRQIDRLAGLQRFIDSRETLERSVFGQYVSLFLKDAPVRAFEWIPRVSAQDRDQYESQARKDGLDGFFFYEKDAAGKRLPVSDRLEYFPVYYLEPLKGNEAALGYDLLSEPVRRAAMEKSRDTGRLVATPPIELVQQGQKKTGIIVFMPVYAKDQPRRTLEQRRVNLRGYVLAVYNADDFINGVNARMPSEGLDCLVADLAAPVDRQVFYKQELDQGAVKWKRLSGLKYEMSLDVPDRHWHAIFVPNREFIKKNHTHAFWWMLPIGLLLTAFFAVFVNFLFMSRFWAERLVKVRTRELNEEKRRLAIAEGRFHQLAAECGEVVWEVDRSGMYTYVSPMSGKIYGFKPEEMVGKKYFYDLFSAGDRAALKKQVFESIEKKESLKDFTNTVIDRQGRKIFLLTSVMVMVDNQGDVTGCLGLDRDMTDYLKTEEALRVSERLLHEMTANVPGFLYQVYFKPNGEMGFHYVSGKAEELFGIKSVPEGFFDRYLVLVVPEYREGFIASIQKANREFTAWAHEWLMEKPTGERIWCFGSAMPLKRENETIFNGIVQDITARKELERSQKLLLSILEATPDFTGIADAKDLTMTYLNPAGRRMIGIGEQEEPLCLKIVDIHPGWLSELLRDVIIPVAIRDGLWVGDCVFRHRDGHEIYVLMVFLAHHGPSGEVDRFSMVAHDITNRKNLERAMWEQNEVLTQFVKNSPIYSFIKEVDAGRVVTLQASDNYQQMLGFPAREMLGKPMEDVFPPEIAAKIIADDTDAVSRGEVITVYEEFNGRSYQTVKYPIVCGEKRLLAGHTIDVTERNQYEARLKDASEKLRMATTSGGVGIWDWDVVHNVLVWDEQMFRLYGTSSREFASAYEAWASRIHPQDRARVDEDIQKALRGEKEYDTQFRVIWKDGTVRYICARGHRHCDAQGTPLRLMGINYDVTEQERLLEEQKKFKNEAECASRAKDLFLANMSHEIRTPLNAITGFADLLGETKLGDVQRDYIRTIKASCDALLGLVTDILDISKIESGGLLLETIPFDLEYLAGSALKIVKGRVQGKPVALLFEIATSRPMFFKGDPTRIRQIIINLLGNAVKFTERGEIKLTLSVSELSAGTDGRLQVMISVKDTGIGIRPDKQGVVFNTFTQADETTTREYGGTGLGLSISRSLARKMGGDIELHSQFGEGSEFVVILPLEEAAAAGLLGQDMQGNDELKGKRIALVDGSEPALKSFGKYCKESGMEVLFQAAGAQAFLEWLDGQQVLPEVVLLEMVMPGMDGFELARRLRQVEKYGDIKLVATTAAMSADVVLKLQNMEFDGFLSKPVLRQELIKVMQDVFKAGGEEHAGLSRVDAGELSIRGLKVLVVEDKATNRMLMKEYLDLYGCICDFAENGKIGVEKMRHKGYDVCFMDIQMPVMGGFEAARLIREVDLDTPIIALTAAAMREDEKMALDCGMNAYLTKPVDRLKLKEHLLNLSRR